MDGQQAIDAVADAFWWLRGFTSAQPENEGAAAAAESTRLAHLWLRSLLNGSNTIVRADRRPIDKQGYRIAISEAQFERLLDGLRSNDPADRADGLACATEILERTKRELASLQDPNAFF